MSSATVGPVSHYCGSAPTKTVRQWSPHCRSWCPYYGRGEHVQGVRFREYSTGNSTSLQGQSPLVCRDCAESPVHRGVRSNPSRSTMSETHNSGSEWSSGAVSPLPSSPIVTTATDEGMRRVRRMRDMSHHDVLFQSLHKLRVSEALERLLCHSHNQYTRPNVRHGRRFKHKTREE